MRRAQKLKLRSVGDPEKIKAACDADDLTISAELDRPGEVYNHG
jgi:hypothetical protein